MGLPFGDAETVGHEGIVDVLRGEAGALNRFQGDFRSGLSAGFGHLAKPVGCGAHDPCLSHTGVVKEVRRTFNDISRRTAVPDFGEGRPQS